MSIVRGPDIVYPESDGKPMADNTLQYKWMTTIKGNLDVLFADRPDVFVAGDLLWYPVEGEPEIVRGPDVMVALGRPKGDRGSYRQWVENDVAPQVVFEILSPSNHPADVADMEDFYEQYGVEEFYWYDPGRKQLRGRRRSGGVLVRIQEMEGWVSPLLGIRFEMADDLVLTLPTGERFLSFEELHRQGRLDRQRAEQERQRAEQERQRAVQAEAEIQRLRALLQQRGIDPSAPGS